MAILKQNLNPENSPSDIIYPATSTDQIVDLPTSAKNQLYAHYMSVIIPDNKAQNVKGFTAWLFFINASATPVTSYENLISQIQSRIVCVGISAPITGDYILVADRAFMFDGVFVVGLTSPDRTNTPAVPLNLSGVTFQDQVIALGSNAG